MRPPVIQTQQDLTRFRLRWIKMLDRVVLCRLLNRGNQRGAAIGIGGLHAADRHHHL